MTLTSKFPVAFSGFSLSLRAKRSNLLFWDCFVPFDFAQGSSQWQKGCSFIWWYPAAYRLSDNYGW